MHSVRAAGPVTTSVRGKYEVAVTFPEPVAGVARLFDQVAILSDMSPLKERAVLGPFRIAEHKPGSYLLLERNPNYWKTENGRRLPYLDRVRLGHPPEPRAGTAAVQAGTGPPDLRAGPRSLRTTRRARSLPGSGRRRRRSRARCCGSTGTPPRPSRNSARPGSGRGTSAAPSPTPSAATISAGSSIAGTPCRASDPSRRRTVLVQPGACAARLRSVARPRLLAARRLPPGRRHAPRPRRPPGGVLSGHQQRQSRRASGSSAMLQQDLAALGIKLNIVPLDFPLADRAHRPRPLSTKLPARPASTSTSTPTGR